MLSLLVTTIGVLQGSLALSFERQLTGELLENYCSSARPVKNDSDTVELKLGLTLHQILDVDTNVQTMTGLYWLNLEWRDEYLVWDEDKYGGLYDIRLRPDSIWVPDIEPYNMINIEYLRGQRESTVVTSSGMVTWIPPVKLTSTCKIDKEKPDVANCEVKLGSWTYNGFKLNLKMLDESGADLSTYVSNANWELVGAPGQRNEVIYDCCPEPYIDITYIIKLKKREKTLWEQTVGK